MKDEDEFSPNLFLRKTHTSVYPPTPSICVDKRQEGLDSLTETVSLDLANFETMDVKSVEMRRYYASELSEISTKYLDTECDIVLKLQESNL